MKQEKQTPLEWLIFNTMTKQQKVLHEREIEQALEMEKKEFKEMYLKGIENYDTTFKRK